MKTNRMLIALILVTITSLIVCSSATANWEVTFGGEGYEKAHNVRQTSDGGYIIIGTSLRRLWLIKTDSNGTKQWERFHFKRLESEGWDIRQTKDRGYIAVGLTHSDETYSQDLWLIRTDSSGYIQWDRTFGGELNEVGYSLDLTGDGGFVIVGRTGSFGTEGSAAWLIKTDSSGRIQWSRRFGGTGCDIGRTVRQTTDGGYIIVGETDSFGIEGNYNIWLIKTDPDGMEEWDQTFAPPNNKHVCGYVYGNSGRQTKDGGYIIAGGLPTSDINDEFEFWLIKTDANGKVQWERSFYTDPHCIGGFAHSVEQTFEGGYVATGFICDFENHTDLYLVKTDANGAIEWDRRYDNVGFYDIGYGVQQTSDGEYIVAGAASTEHVGGEQDAWLVKASGPCTYYFPDSDGDGYGDSSDFLCLEGPAFPYVVAMANDCDDGDPDVNPGENEIICNGKDDDCDPRTHDDPNNDGDPVSFCAGDCDDNDPARYPGNPEIVCNGIDEDCSDATLDDLNDDGDPVSLCQGDCDDDDPTTYPGAQEICGDGIDHDCDSLVDDDDPDCTGISRIRCIYPPNQAIVFSSPSFTWTVTGGLNNRFAVDLSYDWTFSSYWSTYENLHRLKARESWQMPQQLWSYIPSGSYVYWRVRGADLAVTPLTIVTSEEVWWFYKW